jgi:hypothetical protein
VLRKTLDPDAVGGSPTVCMQRFGERFGSIDNGKSFSGTRQNP